MQNQPATKNAEPPENDPAASATIAQGHAARQLTAVVLLVIGALLWWAMGPGRGIGLIRWVLIGVAGVGAAAVSWVWKSSRRQPSPLFARINQPSAKLREWTTFAIAILSAAYLILTAFNQQRDLFPKTHDECSYAIGMQIMARLRLWMPALPVPDFFDSFYILTTPKYCSKYFPGTALLFVPTVWLHWPTWLLPAMASGACVALVYSITTDLLDGTCGLLAALMMVALSWFRMYSVLLASNVPMLLMALLLYWAWTRWRTAHRFRWALMMGIFAGWGAITRPIDAIVVALPVAAAVVWELWRRIRPAIGFKTFLITAAAAVIGALPFLALQIIFNIGVTGHALQTPYGYYIDRNQPNTTYGFHAIDPRAAVQSPLLQKQEYFSQWVQPFIINHRPTNLWHAWRHTYLPMIVDTTMQCRMLLLFVLLGLMGLTTLRRWVFWLALPLFIAFYVFSTFFLEHYAILVAPAVIVTILMGGRALAGAFPRCSNPLFAAFAAIVVMISLTSFWEINRWISTPQTRISDETFPSPLLRYVNEVLPLRDDIQKPALVLFTYHAGGNFFEEPVYNTDVAQPLDAPIARAHDLGPRNHELFAYYATLQPQRTFYRFDTANVKTGQDPLVKLGTAAWLARENKAP